MGTVRFFRNSTRLFRYHVPTEFVVLAALEFLALIASLYLALEMRFAGSGWQAYFGSFTMKAVLYAVVMQLSLIAFGVYQRQAGRFADALMLRIASGLLLGLIPLGVSYYVAPQFFLGRGVLALTVLNSFVLISVIRLFFRRVVKERNMWTRVLVLGAGNKARLIKQAQESNELKGINIIGFVLIKGDKQFEPMENQIELDEPLVHFVEHHDIDEIVLAMDDRRDAGLPTKDLLDCKMSGIDILDLLTFFERRTFKIRLDLMYPSWLYLSDGFHESTIRRVGKRVFDIGIVSVLIVPSLPLMLLTALAIFVESGFRGSVIYSQTRVKQDGHHFQIYKFRSMVEDAEKDGVPRWASKNDDRITRVGRVIRKIRFDELPQLFNILKGDMSFVGPRPERPEFVAKLAEKIPYYEERHRVKPGLTGWAQIRYRYGDTEEDSLQKLQYDLYYVKNFNIFLDILILLQTAEVVLMSKGAQ